jgi:hypothetical protein
MSIYTLVRIRHTAQLRASNPRRIGREQRAVLTRASIQATDTVMDWSRSADLIFGSHSRQHDGTPVQIIITGLAIARPLDLPQRGRRKSRLR